MSRIKTVKDCNINIPMQAKCKCICRFCLKFVENKRAIKLTRPVFFGSTNINLQEEIQSILPGIDLELTTDPVLCDKCMVDIRNITNFRDMCKVNQKCISWMLDKQFIAKNSIGTAELIYGYRIAPPDKREYHLPKKIRRKRKISNVKGDEKTNLVENTTSNTPVKPNEQKELELNENCSVNCRNKENDTNSDKIPPVTCEKSIDEILDTNNDTLNLGTSENDMIESLEPDVLVPPIENIQIKSEMLDPNIEIKMEILEDPLLERTESPLVEKPKDPLIKEPIVQNIEAQNAINLKQVNIDRTRVMQRAILQKIRNKLGISPKDLVDQDVQVTYVKRSQKHANVEEKGIFVISDRIQSGKKSKIAIKPRKKRFYCDMIFDEHDYCRRNQVNISTGKKIKKKQIVKENFANQNKVSIAIEEKHVENVEKSIDELAKPMELNTPDQNVNTEKEMRLLHDLINYLPDIEETKDTPDYVFIADVNKTVNDEQIIRSDEHSYARTV